MRKRLFEAWPSKETSSWWDAVARLSLPFYRTSCISGWWRRLTFVYDISRATIRLLKKKRPSRFAKPTKRGTVTSEGFLVRMLMNPTQYHLVINTGRTGFAGAAQIIAEALVEQMMRER